MAAEVATAACIGAIKSIAKRCKDLCEAAQVYPEEAARIHLRLMYLLSRVPEWSIQITKRADEPGCTLLVQNLFNALRKLTTCVEALGTTDQTQWRAKIKFFLKSKVLLTELLAAESVLNQALHELNHDNSAFTAQHTAMIHNMLLNLISCNEHDRQVWLGNVFKYIGNIPSDNPNNPKETLKDVIDAELEESYDENNDPSPPPSNAIDVRDPISEMFDNDSSLLITDPSQVFISDKRLGSGGFAKVFKGQFHGIDVAVKVIDIYRNYNDILTMPNDIYEAEIERVRDEAIIMKQCSIHSNIIDVFGYTVPFQKGSEPLIIMELMHASMYSIIHDTSNMRTFLFSTRKKLMRDVASALEYLHLQRYVHQDVKPSNILVNKELTVAKLTDFGVTECKGHNTTRTRQHKTVLSTVLTSSGKKAPGTLTYQAPELVLGRITEASRDAEIYSYGATLWECMTRAVPHDNKSELHIMQLAKHGKKLMLAFPLTQFLEDKHLFGDEQICFQLLEKIAYLCLSKYRESRPNITQVLQLLDGTREFDSHFLTVAPLSIWSEPIPHPAPLPTAPLPAPLPTAPYPTSLPPAPQVPFPDTLSNKPLPLPVDNTNQIYEETLPIRIKRLTWQYWKIIGGLVAAFVSLIIIIVTTTRKNGTLIVRISYDIVKYMVSDIIFIL